MVLTQEHLRTHKCLIIHGDDLGMSHSINQATFDALRVGVITSASVMAPCPWLAEVSEFCRANLDADIGFHLTLTSECIGYRWRPISESSKDRGLSDSYGFMPRSVEELLKSAGTIEHEIRSQWRVLESSGVLPTHMDCHMHAACRSPILLRDYVRYALETNTIAMVRRSVRTLALDFVGNKVKLIPDVNIVSINSSVPAEAWHMFYTDCIDHLPVGLNILLVHLGYDTDELRSVRGKRIGWDAAWRQRDLDAITGAAFKDSLTRNEIVLLDWRTVKELSCC